MRGLLLVDDPGADEDLLSNINGMAEGLEFIRLKILGEGGADRLFILRLGF